ncbi:hypothetical protein LCGC14_2100120 [marine sediment metagenome]|uniref:Uncharacterized protein n=1 Tax=marine sediment metagenome TaxID=412755 RepID=A0A0F9EAC7_9ZZZZ
MTHEQRLTKAIEKAHKIKPFFCLGYESKELIERSKNWIIDEPEEFYIIIFSYGFAKAFWGEEKVCCYCGGGYDDYPCRICEISSERDIFKWQYHQHQMLNEIQEGRNPLKYLEKFL